MRKYLIALLAATLAVLTAGTAHAAAILYGPASAPNGVGMGAWYRASEWDGGEPRQWGTTDWWITDAPADSTPDLKRRSELKAGASQAATQVSSDHMQGHWEGWLKPVLGAAKNDGRSWHSIVQLHGPENDGTYGLAHIALRVVNGYWQLWGSQADGTTYSVSLMPYVDDYAVYAKIWVDTSRIMGEVQVTLDPAGTDPAQTWLHDTEPWSNQWLVWSSGLYRGSGNTPFEEGGIQPTYEQHVYLKDITVTAVETSAACALPCS